MTCAKIECMVFKFYMWRLTHGDLQKTVNNSIWEWNSLLIPEIFKWFTPFTDGWTYQDETGAVATLLYTWWNITQKNVVEADILSNICHSQ